MSTDNDAIKNQLYRAHKEFYQLIMSLEHKQGIDQKMIVSAAHSLNGVKYMVEMALKYHENDLKPLVMCLHGEE